MPLQTLIEARAFDESTSASMNAAYQSALIELGIKDRADPVTQLIAETLVSIFDNGVHDEKLLCERTVAAFQDSGG